MKSTHQRLTHKAVHDALRQRIRPDEADDRQALFCPYFVPLKGVLGSDWGAIVNPASSRFGTLVFEHDSCGCGSDAHGTGRQVVDEWLDRTASREEWMAFAARGFEDVQ